MKMRSFISLLICFGLAAGAYAAGGVVSDPNGTVPNRYVYYPGTEALAEGDIRVVCAGSGMPAARRGQAASCFLIECGNGDKFLFDLGTGSMANIAALMIPYDSLDKVFLSHLHTDHMGDLPTLWAGGWTAGRTGKLRVWGPSGATPEMGTKYAMENMLKFCNWDYVTRAYKINSLPGQIEANEFDYRGINQVVYQEKGVTIRSFPAVHIGDGPVSYSLEYGGKKVVFGGDTVPNKWFLEYAREADLSIHECMQTPDQFVKFYNQPAQLAWRVSAQFHTSGAAFGKIMSLTKPKHAVAYHFFNEEGTRYQIYEEVRSTYSGPLSMCTDMMVWDLKGDTITERMAVSTDEAWGVPGPKRLADPDHTVANPMSKFIKEGIDIKLMLEAQEKALKKFWKENNVKLDPETKKMYKVED
jgi:ribonuclease Z